MTLENHATDAVVAVEPTLAIIKQEQADAAAEEARIQAEAEEAERIAEKRHLLGEVLKMQEDIDARYKAVKAQKKLLKSLRAELEAASDDEELDEYDLRELLRRGKEAYDVQDHSAHRNAGAEKAAAGLLLGALLSGGFARGGLVQPRDLSSFR